MLQYLCYGFFSLLPLHTNKNSAPLLLLHKKANDKRKSASEPHFESYPLDLPIIAKFLDNGDIAVGVFNFMDDAASRWNMTITSDNLGLPRNCSKTFEAVDVWTGEVIKAFNDVLEINYLAPHACRLFRVRIIDK